MEAIESFLVNRTAKDSVFTRLFSDPEYMYELYRSLYPDDHETTVHDLEDITIQNSLVVTIYNDLSFLVGDRLIVFVEAQSTWNDNIVLRELLYLGPTLQRYLKRRGLDPVQKDLIVIPRIEFYVLYTGKSGQYPNQLTLTDTHFQGVRGGIEVSVTVLRDGREGDIIYQYVGFTRVFDEQMKLHKDNKALAVAETIRICRDRGLLAKFMSEREEEVMDLLNNQFEVERVLQIWRREERKEGFDQGFDQGFGQGFGQGVDRNKLHTVKKMLARGYDLEEIADIAEVSLAKVKEIAQGNESVEI